MVLTAPGQAPDLQRIIDSIPALIHAARPDGYIEVAGWNWIAVIHPEDVEGILAKWGACLVTGEIFEYETRVRGAMFHRKVPLRDAKCNIVKW